MTKKQQEVFIAIGKNIRRIRKEAEMTQVGLGKKTGINHSDLSRIENGQKNVELVTIIKIAEALGIELKELF